MPDDRRKDDQRITELKANQENFTIRFNRFEEKNDKAHGQTIQTLTKLNDTLLKVCGEIKHTKEKVSSHDEFIHGNGQPGAKVMLDRHNQSAKARKIYHGTIITVVAGLGLTTLWDKLFK